MVEMMDEMTVVEKAESLVYLKVANWVVLTVA